MKRKAGKQHFNCDDKFCIKQASAKRTVKGRDEIIFKSNRKYVCSVPVGYWGDVLNKRVADKISEERAVKSDIRAIEADCYGKYGISRERETIQPNVWHPLLVTREQRYPGAIYPNPKMESCMAQVIPHYRKLLGLVKEEMYHQDEANRYENNKFLSVVDEIDLPTVEKRKIKVVVDPRTHRTELPKIELVKQKLRIFRETLPDLPDCSKKIGDTYV